MLIHGDCLEEMKKLKDDSIDLLFCDLPYGQTSCKWDCEIDLNLFWKQVNRICKDTTPMFFTCSTKFGVSLINSNPKNFRYDIVWVKSAPCGFLNAKKMPLKKHELIFLFYRKLPFYDLSSHKHKFLNPTPKDVNLTEEPKESVITTELYSQKGEARELYRNKSGQYDPELPTTILRQSNDAECYDGNISYNYEERDGAVYEPKLPDSILEIKSEKGKHATQKPTALIEWCLKYYSKEGDTVLDPTMGSGSTGVACKNMKRQFIGIEKDKDIYDVAVKRVS
jgi:DNA modification methylase